MNTDYDSKLKLTAAIALLACALVSVVFMFHHPYTEAHTLSERLAEIKAESAISAWVHGVLIAVMLGLTYGLYGVKIHVGERHPLSVFAFICFVFGMLTYALAATISGFISTEIGVIFAETTAEDMQLARRFLQLSWVGNQSLSYMGLISTSVAIFLWSLLLIKKTGFARITGVMGLIAGVLPLSLWIFGSMRLNVSGMHFVVIVDAIWYVIVAIDMHKSTKSQA